MEKMHIDLEACKQGINALNSYSYRKKQDKAPIILHDWSSDWLTYMKME